MIKWMKCDIGGCDPEPVALHIQHKQLGRRMTDRLADQHLIVRVLPQLFAGPPTPTDLERALDHSALDTARYSRADLIPAHGHR
ncbi:hypothetical protein FJV83_18035 [Mesorhizobium sp. WSM4307]|uniref:hypothetical protein n=1 Tax=Mesorhizobium sp. WSM4304 TaxID=2029408 RepID=UPI000BB0292F|nr:hypothetical protein [Mesorhizobium sp. WSM4304]PBB22325.1 hypothetical protein CK232_33735 [Mesorhizobium sp. WSM4304]PBB74731.1 hypothetical protein CK227_15710 [Mesorhizobium sp. WSM4308]TRC83377.1 hypothetical protein FJV83_18035 [Mesorhizobium sp. WSM4307]